MALTNTAFQAWLESDTAVRCTLVEVTANIAGTDTVFYISNRTYNTTGSDVPANQSYLPILKNSLNYSESIPLMGEASLSYGDISIDNTNGEYDAWMNYIWVNKPINIFIGDPKFVRDDFTSIYSGIVSDISFSDRNTINISIRSLTQKLNTTLTMAKVGGTGASKDLLRPLVFGEVHNITPLQIDSQLLKYMVHNGPIERLIEVRDNGVPLSAVVGYTTDLTTGTFTLLKPPVGTITCSVQGEQNTINSITGDLVLGTWSFTVAKIIHLIISKYASTTVSPSEVDLQAFSDFDVTHQQPVGLYITQESNIIGICQELAASVGAQFTSTRAGLITLLKLTVPITDAGSKNITDDDIVRNSLSISQKVPVQATIKLAYCKNWTIQTQLLTGIPEEHKTMYLKEYYFVSADDATIRVNYKLPAEPDPVNTLLITDSTGGVTAEATRRLNLWKTPRYVFKLSCIPKFLNIKLGEMIKITHYRFGLATTKSAQVISLQTDWNTGSVSMEVLV
jgi:hypothetical protein